MELSKEEWTRSIPTMVRRRARSSVPESGEGSSEMSVHQTPTMASQDRGQEAANDLVPCEDEAEVPPVVDEATADAARGGGNATSNSTGWAKRAFEKREGRFVCIVEAVAGKECGHQLTSSSSSNMCYHLLREHNIATSLALNGKLPRNKQQPTLDAYMSHDACQQFSQDEAAAIAWAVCNLAYVKAESPVVRRGFTLPHTSAGKMRRHVLDMAQRLSTRALNAVTGCATVAIDTGTVVARYLVGVVHMRDLYGGSLLLGLWPITEMEAPATDSGESAEPRFTAASMAPVLSTAIARLPRNVYVGCVVSDNAANMRALRRQPSLASRFFVWCWCHGLQLVVRDVQAANHQLAAMRAAAEALVVNAQNGLPRFIETRWCYDLRVYRAILQHATRLTSVSMRNKIEAYVSVFSVVEVATDILQRSQASMFDVFVAMQLIETHDVPDPCKSLHEELRGALRTRLIANQEDEECEDGCLLSDPFLVLLFMWPSINRTNCSQAYVERVRRIVGSNAALRLVLYLASGTHYTVEELQRELFSICCGGLVVKEAEELTYDEVRSYWLEAGIARGICAMASAMLDFTPSEADCERVFSEMARHLNTARRSLHHLEVAAHCRLLKCARELNVVDKLPRRPLRISTDSEELIFEGAPQDEGEADGTERRAVSTAYMQSLFDFVSENVTAMDLTTKPAAVCAKCGLTKSRHTRASEYKWCTRCTRCFFLECEAVLSMFVERVMEQKDWTCSACRS